MNKKRPNLTARIAELGTGLALQQRPVEPDIVVDRPKLLKSVAKHMGIHLSASDVLLLDELEIWARQNGLRAGRGTLLKAGIRLLRKDETALQAVKQVIESDRRRRG